MRKRIHPLEVCRHCQCYARIRARSLCDRCYRSLFPSARRDLASGETICIDPGPRRGRPSHSQDGHEERMAAHAERVAREDPMLRNRPVEDPDDLDTRRAAELLGIAMGTLTRWVRDGKIPARRVPAVGRRFVYRIRRADLVGKVHKRGRMMRIYLAARYSRRSEMLAFAHDLEELGHDVVSRWIRGHDLPGGRPPDEERKLRAALAEEDLADLGSAELMIAFTEEPRAMLARPGRGGRHVEFGVALALNIPTIMIGPRETVFHCLPRFNRQYRTAEECLAALASAQE